MTLYNVFIFIIILNTHKICISFNEHACVGNAKGHMKFYTLDTCMKAYISFSDHV